MCFLLSTFKSLEKSHGNIPKLVFTISVTFFTLIYNGNLAKFTEYSDTKKNNYVTTNYPSCKKIYFFTCDILMLTFILILISNRNLCFTTICNLVLISTSFHKLFGVFEFLTNTIII